MTSPPLAPAEGASGFDPQVLDDPERLAALDSGGMLRALATGGPQVRAALTSTREADLGRIVAQGRPRALVVAGSGTAGLAGDLLAACTAVTSPTPVHVVKGSGLPGWVGPLDLVVAVSCSGTAEETLAVAEEAARRGTSLVTVGAANSALARLAEQARGVHVPVAGGGRASRANLWSLAVPLLALADGLALAAATGEMFARTADRLDLLAEACGPGRDSADNPGKALAAALADALPVIVGSGGFGEVWAYRFACQLAANAKVAALHGALPEAGHQLIVTFDGRLARSRQGEDFFRDRIEDPDAGTQLTLVLLRDAVEDARVLAGRRALRAVAEARDVPVRELVADGADPVERIASLIGICDYASCYVALATGIDPSPVGPADEWQRRMAQ